MHTTRSEQPAHTTEAPGADPFDLAAVRAAVRRALQERPRPLPAREVREITATLRAHLQRMFREAQNRADRLERGTEAWIRWTALIMRAEDELYRECAPGAHAAAARMNDLGRTCRRLVDCLDE
ncbi:DUF6415 family natural product biosynthesis protein [Streptomyces sp. NPDC002536]